MLQLICGNLYNLNHDIIYPSFLLTYWLRSNRSLKFPLQLLQTNYYRFTVCIVTNFENYVIIKMIKSAAESNGHILAGPTLQKFPEVIFYND